MVEVAEVMAGKEIPRVPSARGSFKLSIHMLYFKWSSPVIIITWNSSSQLTTVPASSVAIISTTALWTRVSGEKYELRVAF